MGSLVVITTNDDLDTGFEDDGIEHNSADVSFGAAAGEGLIPGLPDEVALRCLALVPYLSRMRLSLVCKAWRGCFRSSAIYNIRHQAQRLEEILCLSFLDKAATTTSSSSSSNPVGSPCLSLKLLDREHWRWLPLASEYRHTKCKVRSFQCRAFQHKVFVFSQADWAILKDANWPNFAALGGPLGPLDIPDVVPCCGDFYSLEGAQVRKFVPGSASWEAVVDLPRRHLRSSSYRQKYFLVALGGQLALIDVWQERWFWRGRVKANMSFLSLGGSSSLAGGALGGVKWGPLHRPVCTSGKDVAGFAVFHV